jgi:Holliday junction resolvasome RuvABC endonuclease subunit
LNLEEFILTELRDLRIIVTDSNNKTGERLARLETDVKSLLGNGQPGRIGILEATVARIDRFKYWLMGGAASFAFVADLVYRFFKK